MLATCMHPAYIPTLVMEGEVIEISETRFAALNTEFPGLFVRFDPTAPKPQPEPKEAEVRARPRAENRMSRPNLVS